MGKLVLFRKRRLLGRLRAESELLPASRAIACHLLSSPQSRTWMVST